MKKYKNFVTEAGRCWPGHKPVPGKKPFSPGSCVKEEVIQEGRPSQRHPLEGHDYHKKNDAELTYIAKDAHKAAEAMKSHNTTAENKYRDQANDSATVRYWRQKNGMPDWYKKKYGHIKEEVEQIDELKTSTLLRYQTKANKALIGGDRNKEEKRIKGIQKANYKIQNRYKVKEEAEQIDEVYDIEHIKYINTKEGDKHFEDGHATMMKHIGDEFQKVNAKRYAHNAFKENPHKKETKEHKAWHHGADAARDEHIGSLHEASAAWQRKEGKNPEGGLNRKGIASYRAENPGSKLSMAVTTPPSKLKAGSKAANRRKSFCARMGGMPGPMKKPNGEPTRKALSLKKWNC